MIEPGSIHVVGNRVIVSAYPQRPRELSPPGAILTGSNIPSATTYRKTK